MRRLPCRLLLAVITALLGLPAAAATFEFPPLGAHALEATVPDHWQGSVRPGPMPEAATVRFTTGAADASVVLMTVIVPPPGGVAPTAAGIRESVEQSATHAAAQSVEGAPAVHDFAAGDVSGAYFSVTDRAPPPGEFKYMSQGAAMLSGVTVSFTVLSNAEPTQARDAVLDVVKSMRMAAPR